MLLNPSFLPVVFGIWGYEVGYGISVGKPRSEFSRLEFFLHAWFRLFVCLYGGGFLFTIMSRVLGIPTTAVSPIISANSAALAEGMRPGTAGLLIGLTLGFLPHLVGRDTATHVMKLARPIVVLSEFISRIGVLEYVVEGVVLTGQSMFVAPSSLHPFHIQAGAESLLSLRYVISTIVAIAVSTVFGCINGVGGGVVCDTFVAGETPSFISDCQCSATVVVAAFIALLSVDGRGIGSTTPTAAYIAGWLGCFVICYRVLMRERAVTTRSRKNRV